MWYLHMFSLRLHVLDSEVNSHLFVLNQHLYRVNPSSHCPRLDNLLFLSDTPLYVRSTQYRGHMDLWNDAIYRHAPPRSFIPIRYQCYNTVSLSHWQCIDSHSSPHLRFAKGAPNHIKTTISLRKKHCFTC